MSETLLQVAGLQAWYGESHVLHGVDFEVRAGEVVTLLGRNGAGKTTTLKSIMGMVPRRAGSVRFRGEELIGRRDLDQAPEIHDPDTIGHVRNHSKIMRDQEIAQSELPLKAAHQIEDLRLH